MIQHFTLPSGERMAYRFLPGVGPVIVFLPGYMSDMSGGKAQAVMAHAEAQGRACLLLDYTGLGQSDGAFAEKTLPLWRDEVISLLDHLGIERVILCGSSMGGWLMLLLAEPPSKAPTAEENASRGDAGAALCLCLTLRARSSGRGADAVPRTIPAFGAA